MLHTGDRKSTLYVPSRPRPATYSGERCYVPAHVGLDVYAHVIIALTYGEVQPHSGGGQSVKNRRVS